jgi:hypothetical protein
MSDPATDLLGATHFFQPSQLRTSLLADKFIPLDAFVELTGF